MVQVPGAARRAAAFRRMRDARSSEVAEDYVELVGDLITETGAARLTDLADCLGVAPATASKALQRLQRDGLVEAKPYRSITLTEAGETMAAASPALELVMTLCAGRNSVHMVTETVSIPIVEYGTLSVEDFMVSLYNDRTVQRLRLATAGGESLDMPQVLAEAIAALPAA